MEFIYEIAVTINIPDDVKVDREEVYDDVDAIMLNLTDGILEVNNGPLEDELPTGSTLTATYELVM